MGYSVQQTSDSGYVVAGFTSSSGAGQDGIYLIKTDANGDVGVEEPTGRRPEAVGHAVVTPNPFVSFARIPGHVAERVELYDISGKMVGAYPRNRVGEGLPPAVYFIKAGADRTLRVVKAR